MSSLNHLDGLSQRARYLPSKLRSATRACLLDEIAGLLDGLHNASKDRDEQKHLRRIAEREVGVLRNEMELMRLHNSGLVWRVKDLEKLLLSLS